MPAPVVVRPTLLRRVLVGLVLAVFVLGLPLLLALFLALSDGAGPLFAILLVVLSLLLTVVGVSNLSQRWVVTDDSVELRRLGRAPRIWPREGLRVDATSTPVYHRGIRTGTRRTLLLHVGGHHDELVVGALGGGGLTALVAAIREPGQGDVSRELRGMGQDLDDLTTAYEGADGEPWDEPVRRPRRDPAAGRVRVDHEALAAYLRWRMRWRLIGVAAVPTALLCSGAAFDAGWDFGGSMLIATAALVPAYVVASFVRQGLHRRHGPTPLAVAVSAAGVDVERDGDALGDRFAWSELARVEVSGDDNGEVVLRLVPRTGEPAGYGLTGGATEDHRAKVLPDHDRLLDLLHDHGPPHGVDVVELQR